MLLAVLSCGLLLAAVWRQRRATGHPLGDVLLLGWAKAYARLWHGCRVNRAAGLPPSGPAILVANHTCSADPAFIAAGCERALGFLVAQKYFRIPVAHAILRYLGCVPVRRDGRDWVALRRALGRLREGRVICIYPEGGLTGAVRGRTGRGKAGVTWLALRSGVPLIPLRIDGGPRTHHLLRAWLRPSRGVRVTYGTPIDLPALAGRRLDRRTLEAAHAAVMRRLTSLSWNAREAVAMTTAAQEKLTQKHCVPCEGGVQPLTPERVRELLGRVSGWRLTAGDKAVRREWRVKDFATALDFFQRIGRIAEAEDHHPDLHLTGYRNVAVELSTHAVDGLTENDFILAAKIDELPVELKG
jgi:4a-hydroxytetrahydrobiopterin dehydratase